MDVTFNINENAYNSKDLDNISFSRQIKEALNKKDGFEVSDN